MKKLVRLLCDAFELGDHEYIRASFQHWPFSAWLTILEPRYRRGWKRLMPWRVRFVWATLLRQIVWSHCTKCSQKIRASELISRDSRLEYHMSGSICHRDCEPTEEFKAMVRDLQTRYAR